MHGHDGCSGGHGHGGGDVRRLAAVLVLTVLYTLAEIVGGLWAGSLALLADAGHMMTDNLALGLALFAAWSARRPPDPARTYGYRRAEILAALVNGVALLAVAVIVVREAVERLAAPTDVDVPVMAAVAAGGLVVNIVGAVLLHGKSNLNVRGAYLHVLGDLLGSIGVLVAAALTGWLGWRWADPAAGIVIAGIIVVSSVRLIREAVHVLMEGVPTGLEVEPVRDCLLELPGVTGMHDLHLWTLGGGDSLLSAHLVTDGQVPPSKLLRTATTVLRERFGIEHATLQIEPPEYGLVPLPGVADATYDRKP